METELMNEVARDLRKLAARLTNGGLPALLGRPAGPFVPAPEKEWRYAR